MGSTISLITSPITTIYALLFSNGDSLGIFERLFEAALDLNQIHDAQDYLEFLRANNPNGDSSIRYRMHLGKFHEAIGDYNEAIEIYRTILNERAYHKEALKRKVAVAKELNGPKQAIKWLNQFLLLHLHVLRQV